MNRGKLATHDEDRKVLVELGLTSQQAKVYLALSKLQQASVRTMSEAADIDRTEVYRAISGLQVIGLVEEIIAKPLEYRVLPLKQGIKFLVDRKKLELLKIEQQAKELLKNQMRKSIVRKVDDERMSFVYRSESYFPKMKEAMMNDQSSLDVLTNIRRFLEFDDFHTNVFDPGCDMPKIRKRLIIEIPMGQPVPEFLTHKKPKPLEKQVSIRTTTEEIAAPLGIHDKRELMIFVSENTGFREASMLHTTNPRIVKLAVGYFEGLWEKAVEIDCLDKNTGRQKSSKGIQVRSFQ